MAATLRQEFAGTAANQGFGCLEIQPGGCETSSWTCPLAEELEPGPQADLKVRLYIHYQGGSVMKRNSLR